MSAPVEFFTLRLLPGEIYHLDTIRDLQITNVSYSEPENLKGKKRSVLRVHYAGNPIDLEDDEDVEIEDDDEDEREDDEDEEEDDEDEDDDDEEEEDDDEEDDIVDMEPRVPIFTDDDSYVVCSLIPEKVEQVTLNLQISEEEEVGLSVSGDEPVDIIGNYLLPTSLNDLDPELLGELEDEDDEEDAPLPFRRPIIPAGQPLPPQPSPNEISPEAQAAALAVEQTAAKRLSLMELTEKTCKWPVGDPATPSFWFCGLPSQSGKPYCEAHVSVAFQPMSSRRDRRR